MLLKKPEYDDIHNDNIDKFLEVLILHNAKYSEA